ncbi:GNAT family N-acetyltransferase [Pseudoduganella sp. DS3]|uniref:GNAT family N-acetyltransferase n=1 Tax=Pseudoduganella guangdongensis TaxID=2692179 RepID=A0A6N9HKH1_9BURK|nr:GNAT family N-acetyltransferase [Pseudoduganella guangdongensis]MYN04094.1 GNAT family N-acetyltransferase [Pseudoduganella guangdongensis]
MIRAYTEQDFSAVCCIYREAKADELRFEASVLAITPLEQDARILAAFTQAHVTVYADGAVLGFAATHEGRLRALFVGRAARGRGVGRALLRAALEGARSGLQLNVARSNLDARAFYEKSGFVVTGEINGTYDGREVVYLTMRAGPLSGSGPDE